MKNKVIIPINSGLDQQYHRRALESLAEIPLDILAFNPDYQNVKIYPHLRLAACRERGKKIGYSELTPMIDAPFYKIDFHGTTQSNIESNKNPQTRKIIFQYSIFSERRRIGDFRHAEYWEEDRQMFSFANSFCFIFKISSKKLLGPDGNPLYQEIVVAS